MRRGAKIAIIIGALALIVFLLLVSPYNSLVNLDEQVSQAQANVQVVLQRRLDLIPNLVETVKGYASHERETLEAVVKARQQVMQAPSLDQKLAANQELTSALGRLMVVVERYPDLKASENFRALQDQLEGTENRISVARTRYNDAVRVYNTEIRSLPTVFLARLLGYQARQPFTAAPEAQTAPKVNFK
ncbi:MAG: LemA family protein [Deltaproteobacteria bacterium]|nr:LemA family protein [Deltaproteobacteria bacterium]